MRPSPQDFPVTTLQTFELPRAVTGSASDRLLADALIAA